MPAPDKKNFTNRPQYQLAMYWYNQGKADLEAELTRLPATSTGGEEPVARVPKVRTSHHRNKEEAARLQELIDKRYAIPTAMAQSSLIPAAWQYRVMFDATHARRDEWCPWCDAGEKYFNKVNAEIAAGATRVETRVLYAISSTEGK